MKHHIILIKCPDENGLIAKITNILSVNGLNVLSNQEYVLPEDNMFFMRSKVEGEFNETTLKDFLLSVLPENATVEIKNEKKKNIIIFATKEAHCIGDLLIRNYADELNANVLAVVSNHETLKPLVDGFGIPYFFVDHNGCSREEHEHKVLQVISKFEFDYLVFAKYMRIISNDFTAQFPNQIINIHHSFLPAFIGANPYRQAYERGVKIIGATAHFVTPDLDEGPIIEQSVINIDHKYNPNMLAKAGHDVEKVVLARAIKLAIENRIFVHQNKTVVFK